MGGPADPSPDFISLALHSGHFLLFIFSSFKKKIFFFFGLCLVFIAVKDKEQVHNWDGFSF